MADLSVSDKVGIVKLHFNTDKCVAAAIQCFRRTGIKNRENYSSITSVVRVIRSV